MPIHIRQARSFKIARFLEEKHVFSNLDRSCLYREKRSFTVTSCWNILKVYVIILTKKLMCLKNYVKLISTKLLNILFALSLCQ